MDPFQRSKNPSQVNLFGLSGQPSAPYQLLLCFGIISHVAQLLLDLTAAEANNLTTRVERSERPVTGTGGLADRLEVGGGVQRMALTSPEKMQTLCYFDGMSMSMYVRKERHTITMVPKTKICYRDIK